MYLEDGLLGVQLLGRGFAWLEEIAFINGWINQKSLLKSAKVYGKSPYGAHLKAVAEGKVKY